MADVRRGRAELAGALLCANVASWALLDTASDRAAPHRLGLDVPRSEIHRATGMVMAQLKISAESALATLRAFAYSNALPLGDVARQVVTGQLRFPVDDQ